MELINLNRSSLVCRICFQSDDEARLVQPCDCRGSLACVHEDCIKNWILMKFPSVFGSSCEICKQGFVIKGKTRTRCQAPKGFKGLLVFLVKLLMLFLLFSVLVVMVVIACVFYVDFVRRMVYSVLVLVFCGIPIVLNAYYMLKVILMACLVTDVNSWSVLSNRQEQKPMATVKPFL